MRPDEAFGADGADRAACRAALAALRHDGPFTPPSLEGTLVVPSNIGGAHWGGLAFDSTRQLAVVPVNHLAAVVQLIPRDRFDGRHEPGWEYAEMRGTPYLMRRQIAVSPRGVPCSPPPFGTLVAIDVGRGTVAWRVPLGTPGALATGRTPPVAAAGAGTPAAAGGAPGGAARTSAFRQAFAVRGPGGADSLARRALGSPNLGGPIVTAGGLVFIAATVDQQLRAFDVDTGRELWRGALPAGGKATPMTYAAGGRQYVAVAAGGDGGDIFGKGDEVVVFALPAP
jgi:quinoprotein glucose dehydrogenase